MSKFKGWVGNSYVLRNTSYDCQRTINLFPSVDEVQLGKGAEVAQLERTPGLTLLTAPPVEFFVPPARSILLPYTASEVIPDGDIMWFSFTLAVQAPRIDINTAGSDFDTGLALFTDQGVLITWNADFFGSPQAKILLNELDPGTYYLAVYGASEDLELAYNFSVTSPGAGGDLHLQAQVLQVPYTYGGTRTFEDDFDQGVLNIDDWRTSSWTAPGSDFGTAQFNHIGFWNYQNVDLSNGDLTLKLDQVATTNKGDWDAASNLPQLSSGKGTWGDVYTVTVAGNSLLDDVSGWLVGEHALYDGRVWRKTATFPTYLSSGAEITTKRVFGFGTYEIKMRASGTPVTREPVSGSITGAFSYFDGRANPVNQSTGPENIHITEPAIKKTTGTALAYYLSGAVTSYQVGQSWNIQFHVAGHDNSTLKIGTGPTLSLRQRNQVTGGLELPDIRENPNAGNFTMARVVYDGTYLVMEDSLYTEIDFEVEGTTEPPPGDPGSSISRADEYQVTSWINDNYEDNDSHYVSFPNPQQVFADLKWVWTRQDVKFYINDVLVQTNTTKVPTTAAHFIFNHWGTNNYNFGGTSTPNTPRYLSVERFKFTSSNPNKARNSNFGYKFPDNRPLYYAQYIFDEAVPYSWLAVPNVAALRAGGPTAGVFGIRTASWDHEEAPEGVYGGLTGDTDYVVSFEGRKVNGTGWTGMGMGWNELPALEEDLLNPNLTTTWQQYSLHFKTPVTPPALGNLFIRVLGTTATNDQLHIRRLNIRPGSTFVAYEEPALGDFL